MKTLMEKAILLITAAALLLSNLSFGFGVSAEDNNAEEPVISSMSRYKNADYGFLKTFPFGESAEADNALAFDTAEELKSSKDIRLKINTYVRTRGYYSAGDLGGALYRISAEENFGAVLLSNGLYANLIPDRYRDNDGLDRIVLSVKQFGAKGDGIMADQNAINSAFSFAESCIDKDRAIIYLPSGEYKACDQIQANASNIELVGDGDSSVIFTDNDYRKESAFDEPFFACWNGKNNFFGFFKLEAREKNVRKYMRQLCLFYCENMYIYRVNCYIPEETWSGLYFEDKQYTNLTIYSGNKQVTVDNCALYQMSGTYRGANIGIMDFWKAGTEDITIMNCELHDNARDEQIGIFSVSGEPGSYIRNVDFINNTVYTYSTPYRDIHGWRTMCFTVAYGDNNVRDINIAGNNFISEADSKFMTFGSVKDCRVHDNKFQIKSSCGNMGYVFDSSCANDEDVIIYNNEFDLTYKNSPDEGKCLSAGHLTFTGNKVVADSTVYKIADRLGVYENNEFIFLTPLGSCGSAEKFNNSAVTAYAGHSNEYSEIMFMLNEGGSDAKYEYIGNTVTDYEFYNGAKNQKVYDRLSSINGITADTVNFSNNTYSCPNYRYVEDEYIYMSWYRVGSDVKNLICENNDFQGAKGIYGSEFDGGNNTTRAFTSSGERPSVTSVEIAKDGIPITEITTSEDTLDLTAVVKTARYDEQGNVISEGETSDKEIVWLTNFASMASAENGKVTRKQYGDVTVYATSKDGSGVYGKAVIHFVESKATDIKTEQDSITMRQGGEHRVMYRVLPENSAQELEWVSENSDIAAVSEQGVIEAVNLGETYVICRTTDGSNIEKRIKVTVTDIRVTQIVLSDGYDYYENPGVTKQLSVTAYLPESAANPGVSKWESTNETVATVDQNGLVNITGRGSCQIRAYSMDMDRYAAYNIYVRPEKIQNLKVQTTKNGSVIRWDYLENCDGYNLYRAEGDFGEWTKVAGAIRKNNTVYYETDLKADTKYRYYVTALVAGYDTNTRVEYEGIPGDTVSVRTNRTELITSISTESPNLSVPLGYVEEITAICRPGNAENKSLDWQLADPSIAELISENETTAKFKGNAVGFTTLTVSAKDGGGAKTSVTVGVTPNCKVQTAELSNDRNDVTITWKGIDEEEQIDGYLISRTNTMVFRPVRYIPLDELTVTQDENGESRYTFTDYDLTYDLSYRYAVTPYIVHDGLIYTCLRSADLSITIPSDTRDGLIIAEDVHVINIGEEKEISAMAGSEELSGCDFIWYSKDGSVAAVKKTGSDTAMLTGIKTGVTKIEITADGKDGSGAAAKVIVLPGKVNGVSVSETIPAETTITWERVRGATGYNIYRYDPAAAEFVKIGSTSGYLYRDIALNEGSEYIYAVTAYLYDGHTVYEGEMSEEIKIKTSERAPSPDEGGSDTVPGRPINRYPGNRRPHISYTDDDSGEEAQTSDESGTENQTQEPSEDTATDDQTQEMPEDTNEAPAQETSEESMEDQQDLSESGEDFSDIVSEVADETAEITDGIQTDAPTDNENSEETEEVSPKTGGTDLIPPLSVLAISAAYKIFYAPLKVVFEGRGS